jgi:hypothetical protein
MQSSFDLGLLRKKASFTHMSLIHPCADVCRCRVVPFVSKNFRHVHNEFPPKERYYRLGTKITQAQVDWFKRTVNSVEMLRTTWLVNARNSDHEQCLLHEVLSAARAAPKLRSLHMYGNDGGALLPSLGSLSQITKLELSCWKCLNAGILDECKHFTGLRSLEVRHSF